MFIKEIRKRNKIKRAKEMVASAAIGGVITGAAVALFTPKSGKEIREDIKKTAADCGDKACESLDKCKNIVEEEYKKASDKAIELKSAVKAQKEKAKKKTVKVLKDVADSLEKTEEK